MNHINPRFDFLKRKGSKRGFLISLFLTVNGYAATHTVKESGGNFTTIQACADAAQPGDTCLVGPGNFPEHVSTVRNGFSGNEITFKANGVATIEGFRIKHPYIRVDGFDITKYAVAVNRAHITIDPQGSHATIINNTIRDGVQLLSNNYYFNGPAKTISLPAGGFIAAGFKPGTKIYIASNINAWILNHDVVRTVKSVTDTTLTIEDSESLITEGPVFSLVYATRADKSGVGGIGFNLTSSAGAASHCVIKNNLFSNLCGATASIYGSNHTIENNIFEKLNAWPIFTFNGSNNVYRFNHVRNSPRYAGFEAPDDDATHSTGTGSWDFFAAIFRSFGTPSSETFNNVFEFNFFENLDNEFATVGAYAPGSAIPPLPSRKLIFRNNVFANIEYHGSFHVPDIVFENNTFYRAAYKVSGSPVILSSTDEGSAEGAVVRFNAFVHTNDVVRSGSTGSYTLKDVTSFVADYNFVAGSEADGYPTIEGATGREPNGIHGIDPLFKDIKNPLGPDRIPFTLDDGFKPKPDSPLCGAEKGRPDIGAYSCDPTKVFSVPAPEIPKPPVVKPPAPPPGGTTTTQISKSRTAFNPMKGEAGLITINLKQSGNVRATIHNRIGQEIVVPMNQDQPAGDVPIIWDGRNKDGAIVSSGVYLMVIKFDGKIEKKKMVVIK